MRLALGGLSAARLFLVALFVIGVPRPSEAADAAEAIVPLGTRLEDRGYERIAEKNGVTVYKLRGPSVLYLAVEGVFPAPPAQVLALLLDYERHVGHVERISESKILERGRNQMLVYQHLNLPVISDRDFNLIIHWGQTPTQTWLSSQAVSGQGTPPRRGVVRVTDHASHWLLRAEGAGTFGRLQTHIDLAGWIPRWMVRSASGKELAKLFDDLRNMLKSAGSLKTRS